jgi:Zn-dependent protease
VFQDLFSPDKLILIAIFLLVGFPVHEFAHAFAANQLGDSTARHMGRLTLNPITHFDPIGGTLFVLSVLAGFFVIGWAKPTPVNPSNLRDRRNSEVIVAVAGPAVNLVLACLGAFVFRALELAGVSLFDQDGFLNLLGAGLYLFVLYNLMLMLFNLLPVPPLDGSAILFRFLSPQTAWRWRPMLTQYGLLIVLAVVFLGGQFIGTVLYGATDVLVGL